jgi:hypothetical protein
MFLLVVNGSNVLAMRGYACFREEFRLFCEFG